MKIVITGNMGYVGSYLSKYLRLNYPQAEIVGVDLGFFAHCLTAADSVPERFLDKQYFQDIRNIQLELVSGADAVVHLAAISNDPIGNAYATVTDHVNQKATVRLAGLAKKAGVRSLVFASSCSIYGFSEEDARNEHSLVNPLTPYAKSKLAAEKGMMSLAGTDFAITCLRFPTACGMSDRLRLDLVLNDFVSSAFFSGCINILSDGTPWRPVIDVEDMARAIDWAIGRDPSQGGAFLAINAGRTDWNYQVRDLAEAVQAELPNAEISIKPYAQPDKRSYRVSFSLYEELAHEYQPKIPVSESIKRLCAGLERHQSNCGSFEKDQLIRLKVLSQMKQNGLIDNNLSWINLPSLA